MPTQSLARRTLFWRLRSGELAMRSRRKRLHGPYYGTNVHFSIQGVQRVSGELEPAVFKRFADAWREIGLPE
jgi:hypothetical protein